MPRKTKATSKTKEDQGPSQSQIARLITDSYDIMESDFMSTLVEENNGDGMGINRDKLVAIKKIMQKTTSELKTKTLNNLLTYYK